MVWWHHRAVDQVLVKYGKTLYGRGAAAGDFAELLNALVDDIPGWRVAIPGAKELLKRWRQQMPSYNHAPMPHQAWLAMLSVAICWRWFDVLAVLLVAFAGLLRIGEALALEVRHLLLPSSLGLRAQSMYIQIASPKMRNMTARQQHVRIDEPHCGLHGGVGAW